MSEYGFDFTRNYNNYSSGSSSYDSESGSYSDGPDDMEPSEQPQQVRPSANVRKQPSGKPTVQQAPTAAKGRGKATRTKPEESGRSLRNPPVAKPTRTVKTPVKRPAPDVGARGNVPEKKSGIAEDLEPQTWTGPPARGSSRHVYHTDEGHRVEMHGRRKSRSDIDPAAISQQQTDELIRRNFINQMNTQTISPPPQYQGGAGQRQTGQCTIF